MCSCKEQIRDVRYEYHFTSICNLSSKLSSGLHMLSAGVPAWIDLDPEGVTCGGDSKSTKNDQKVKSS